MLTVSTKVYRHAYTTQFRARRSCVMTARAARVAISRFFI